LASVRSGIGENMDRYLYKAKRLDNGEWVQGYYVKGLNMYDKEAYLIFEPTTIFYSSGETDGWSEVDPSTICQCTGLKDKNGKLIWENDILHNGNYFVVKWNESCSRFDIVLNNSNNIPIGKWEPMICDWKTSDFKEYRKAVDYEVIGNVFDNPELLESEKK
jgi:uncharacterized phage protein (TIGR01671 family)